MEPLFDLLEQLKAWHWLSLGLILLAIDAVATGGFFLGIAASAITIWLLKIVFGGMSWQVQLVLFTLLSVVYTILYNYLFKNYNEETDVQNINERDKQMIGRQVTLKTDVHHGQDRIQIGDTFWKVNSDKDYLAGQRVVVTAAENMILEITAAE